MWWLYLLLPATLTHGASIQKTENLLQEPFVSLTENDLPNLINRLEEISREFLESFAAAYERGKDRRKRQAGTLPNAMLLGDSDEVYRLQSVEPLFSMCSPAREIKFIDVNNMTYGVCVSAPSYVKAAVVNVGYFTADGWNVIAEWTVGQPEGLSLFYTNGLLHVLVADSSRKDGISLMQVDLTSHEVIDVYVSDNRYSTAVSIWKMKHDDNYHMAVANSMEDFSSEVRIFSWKETYFDRYQEIQGRDVRHIEPFYIHGAAYLAVANYRRSQDDYLVDSEIFKYHMDDNRWLSFQKIRTYGALQWKAFILGSGTGQEFYLVVANSYQYDPNVNVMSVIYKFEKNMFVPVQCLDTPGATAIATLDSNSRFLVAISSYDSVRFYQYDGWRFVQANIQYTQVTLSFGIRALTFHQIYTDKQEIVLAVSNLEPQHQGETAIYKISFIGEKHLEPWYEKSVEWCQDKRFELESSTELLPGMKDVFYVDQTEPIILNGDLYFETSVNAEKLSTPSLQVLNSGENYDNSFLLRLNLLNEKLESAKNRIDAINKVFEKALRLTGTNEQHVTAIHEYKDVSLLCESNYCHFSNISTYFLNGDEVTDLKSKLVFLDEDTFIDASISVESISAKDINVNGSVNGVSMDTVVTKDGNFNITGFKEFRQTVHANDVEVGGMVDDIKFNPDTVLLSSRHQSIRGNITFSEITTSYLNVRGLVNGVNLTNFYNEVVRTSGNYVITGKKTFSDVIIDDLRMNPGSMVNGVDLQDLYANTLWKSGDQIITAPLSFSSVTMEKNLFVRDTINGISIPGPNVMLVNENATVTAPQVFNANTYMRRLRVLNSINGIAVDPDTGELDILRKGAQQTITGRKTFTDVILNADSYVEGTINGVDIVKLHENSLRSDTPIDIERTWTFKNLTVEGPFDVRGTVSGINLKDVYDRALKLNETTDSTFIFRAPVSIRNLQSEDINGINVKRDFVLVNEPQIITGKKTFRTIMLEENSFVTGLVNGYNLSFLSDSILRIGNQVISSKKIIRGNVKVNNLIINGRLNGIDFGQVITLNRANEITGRKTFSNVTFEELDVKDLTINGLVNGVDVIDMINDTMTYDGVQVVTGSKLINGLLSVSPESNIETTDLNGVDFRALYEDAVLDGKDQIIYGKKVFLGQVKFEHLNVSGSIDGVTKWDMTENWLLKNKEQTLHGTVYFQNVTAKNVIVNGLVNGVELNRLNKTIVKVNEPATIEGPIVFGGNVFSNLDVTATGRIQGLDLYNQAVLRNAEDVIITGVKKFLGPLIIDDLHIQGLLDGVSVQDLCNNTVFLDRAQYLPGLVIKGNVSFEEATVGGTFGGVDLLDIKKSLERTENVTVFDGLKSFETLTIDGGLTVVGTFGGVDIQELERNYMSRTRSQDITAEHNFEELSVEGDFVMNNLNTNKGEVSGINIVSLDRRVLKTVGDQTITAQHNFAEIVFKEDVFINGKVSGVEIPAGLMQRNKENHIKSPKVFQQPVTVLGDLFVEKGNVQGVDVGKWVSSAVLKDGGNFQVSGHKLFHEVTMTDVTVEGLVDGMKIDEDSLLLKTGDQVVEGKKTILNSVDIQGSLTVAGNINGVNIQDLANKSVRKDRNATITGLKTFKKPLTVKYLEAVSVDGVDVTSLQSLVNTSLEYSILQQRLDEFGGFLDEMKASFDNQAVILQYYELYQFVEVHGAYSWLYVPTVNSEFMLLSDNSKGKGCTSVRIFRYNDREAKFEIQKKELVSSTSLAMASLDAWDSTLLVVTNSEENYACMPRNLPIPDAVGDTHTSTVYLYDKDSSTFQPYQNLNTLAAVDVATFLGPDPCIVVVDIQKVVVYCSEETHFTFKEELSATNGRKVSVTNSSIGVMMAILEIEPTQPYEQFVEIYVWDGSNMKFGNPYQTIVTNFAECVLLMSRPHSSETFLIITEGRVPKINNIPRLLIYKYENSNFYKYQEIRDHGELDFGTLPSGQFAFFVLNREMNHLNIYTQKGVSGFEIFDTLNGIGSLTLHAFTRRNVDSMPNHYIALAGSRMMLNHWNYPEHPKILRSKMNGKKFPEEDV